MMLSGGEVAVKLAGSAAKNAAAMLLALARNHKKVYGKTSLKKILQQTRDIRTFSLTPEQYREFSRQAKDKVLFADDTGSSSPTSRKNSKNDRPSVGEQLQSFREKLSGVEPRVPAREKMHSEITK